MGVPVNKVQHQQYLQAQQQLAAGNVPPVSQAVLTAVDPSLLDYQDSINNYIASSALQGGQESSKARPSIALKSNSKPSTKGKSQPVLNINNSARNNESLDVGSEALQTSSDDNNGGNMFPRVSLLRSNNVSTKNPPLDTKKVPSLNLLEVNQRNEEYVMHPSVPIGKQLSVGSSKRNR